MDGSGHAARLDGELRRKHPKSLLRLVKGHPNLSGTDIVPDEVRSRGDPGEERSRED